MKNMDQKNGKSIYLKEAFHMLPGIKKNNIWKYGITGQLALSYTVTITIALKFAHKIITFFKLNPNHYLKFQSKGCKSNHMAWD